MNRSRRDAFGLVLVVAVLAACRGNTQSGGDAANAKADPTAKNYAGALLPRAHVVLTDSLGGQHAVEVEVAATPESRTRGLMWRTELAPGKGMLFIFPREELLSFWMKNTLIPLDMIFIDKNARVVGVVAEAEPRTLNPRSVGRISKYVLEVPGGWARRAGIAAGSAVRFDGLANVTVN